MRAWWISVLIILVSSTTAFAENFAFWGFDFEQTPQEQQRILKARGIGCQEHQGPAFESLNCRIENDTYFGRTYLEKRKTGDIFIGCAFVNLCGGDADIIRDFTKKNLGFSNYSVSTDIDKSSFSNCYHFSETQKLCSHFSTAYDPPYFYGFSLRQEEFTKKDDKKDAKVITFAGIDYSQTPKEQMETLSMQGAECTSLEFFGDGDYTCKMKGGSIMRLGSVISFDCQVFNGCRYSMDEVIDGIKESVLRGDEKRWSSKDGADRDLKCFRGPLGDSLCVVSPQPGYSDSTLEVQLRYDRYERPKMVFN